MDRSTNPCKPNPSSCSPLPLPPRTKSHRRLCVPLRDWRLPLVGQIQAQNHRRQSSRATTTPSRSLVFPNPCSPPVFIVGKPSDLQHHRLNTAPCPSSMIHPSLFPSRPVPSTPMIPLPANLSRGFPFQVPSNHNSFVRQCLGPWKTRSCVLEVIML